MTQPPPVPPVPPPQYLPGFAPPGPPAPGYFPSYPDLAFAPPPQPRRNTVIGTVLVVAVALGATLLVAVAGTVSMVSAARRAHDQTGSVSSQRAVDKAVNAIDRIQSDVRNDLTRLKNNSTLLEAAGLYSEGEVDRRLELFDTLVKTLRDARRRSEAARDQLRKDLAALGVPPERQGQWLAECDRRTEWAVIVQVSNASEKFAVRGRDLLRYLRNTWGVWRVNNGRYEFTDRRILARYNELVYAVDEARAELLNVVHRTRVSRGPASPSAPAPVRAPASPPRSASASASDPTGAR